MMINLQKRLVKTLGYPIVVILFPVALHRETHNQHQEGRVNLLQVKSQSSTMKDVLCCVVT